MVWRLPGRRQRWHSDRPFARYQRWGSTLSKMTYPSRRIWLRWRGDDYLGRETLAKAAGVNVKTIDYHLRRHGHLELLGTGNTGRKPSGPAKPEKIFGEEWPSITALAADLGIRRATVSRMVNHDREKLMVALMAREGRRTKAAMQDAEMIDRVVTKKGAANEATKGRN